MGQEQPRLNTHEHEGKTGKAINPETSNLLYKENVYAIAGCALEVLNPLGHGSHEKPYEHALTLEFGPQKIPHRQQPSYPILYKTQRVGEYIPDLTVGDKVIVDTKTIPSVTDHEPGQMINYLRITNLRVDVILNFSKSKLERQRVVL